MRLIGFVGLEWLGIPDTQGCNPDFLLKPKSMAAGTLEPFKASETGGYITRECSKRKGTAVDFTKKP